MTCASLCQDDGGGSRESLRTTRPEDRMQVDASRARLLACTRRPTMCGGGSEEEEEACCTSG